MVLKTLLIEHFLIYQFTIIVLSLKFPIVDKKRTIFFHKKQKINIKLF